METIKPSPYIFIVQNLSDEISQFTLFGVKENIERTNFGNPKEIRITPAYANVSYLQFLRQSELKPFKCDLIEIFSSNTQLAIPLSYCVSREDGSGEIMPLNDIKKNLLNKADVSTGEEIVLSVDVTLEKEITVETSFKSTILPRTILVIKFFPVFEERLQHTNDGN